MKAMINSIRSELEETIKNQAEDALESVDQRKQGLRDELDAKTEGMQGGLQAVTTPSNSRTRGFREGISRRSEKIERRLE
jgi:hypothetical protein